MNLVNQIEPYITENEKKAVSDYMDSGGWLTEYKKTEEFEQMIADFLGVKYAVVVTSGTAALYLALRALGMEKYDTVIVPDFTMIATPNAVRWADSRVKLCDIERETLCLNLDKIETWFHAKAVIYVPINGRSGDMDKVVDYCKRYDIYLIEDACQAFGSKYNGKYLGTFGEVGVFSFSPHKIITTGQGGAVVTDNEDIYDKVKKLKDFYRTKPGVDVHTDIGYNFKFTDLQAVIGIEQLKGIYERTYWKKITYKGYEQCLEDVDFLEMLSTDLTDTVPWFVDILLKGVDREKFISYLKANGIGSRPFYPPVSHQAPYSVNLTFATVADISSRGLWLPSSIGITLEEIEYVCDVIKKFNK